MSLEEDFKRFEKNVIARFVRVKKRAAFGLFSAVVLETPVDKGVLRNNWFVELDSASTATTENADPSGAAALQRMQSTIEGVNELNSVFLTNNLPYAIPIEYDGYSAKAPEGMVRVNVARWQQFVDDANRSEP